MVNFQFQIPVELSVKLLYGDGGFYTFTLDFTPGAYDRELSQAAGDRQRSQAARDYQRSQLPQAAGDHQRSQGAPGDHERSQAGLGDHNPAAADSTVFEADDGGDEKHRQSSLTSDYSRAVAQGILAVEITVRTGPGTSVL